MDNSMTLLAVEQNTPTSSSQTSKLTMACEVEEIREVSHLASAMSRVRQFRGRSTKFVKERVHHGVHSRLSLSWRVLEQSGDQVNGIGVGLAEDLVERMRLDLRELVLHVVGVHGANLLPRGRTKYLDNLHELVNS